MREQNTSQPNERKFACKLGNREARCGAPGCICIQYGLNEHECNCRCIRDVYKTIPNTSKEVTNLNEFIDKVKQNIDIAIFTINMSEMKLSEAADFLGIFVPEIRVPESLQSKSMSLQIEKKTMKEITSDLGLEISGTST
jgi:predicted transcriptional regulator YheO